MDKIYVVKTTDNTTLGYALSLEEAKVIGQAKGGRWHVDEYPLNKIIDPRHRRTAYSSKQIICGREIPAFTFI